jgi:UDP-N-acetylglucosamine 2-epimerase
MERLRIATVLGARPQFVKAAPLTRRLASVEDITEVLLHTGQHYDHEMSDLFFTQLGLPAPVEHLGVGSGTHGAQTGQMLERVETVLLAIAPDLVMVYGDTNSTLAGALAASKLGIPIAHVEAGLRSYNRDMPEEVNRVLTDHVAELLLCPSDLAVDNLAAEGVTSGVVMVGDLMRDALEWSLTAVDDEQAVLDRFEVKPGGFSLVTIHRPSNTDDPGRFARIMSALDVLGADDPVLFPVHPRTRDAIEAGSVDGTVRLLPPLGHLELLVLAKHARVGLTDSGGLQKELFWLETPAVTLRGETEWPETIAAGWNRLGGDSTEEIVAAARAAASDRPARSELYGDGRAAEHIEEVLRGWRATRV